jgi:hypothetical protein
MPGQKRAILKRFNTVWIATCSKYRLAKSGTDPLRNKSYLEILDTYKKLNYNAVIVKLEA